MTETNSMYGATAVVATETPLRNMKQLCRHFAHKIEAPFDDERGMLNFPIGQCELDAGEPRLLARNARAADEQSLERLMGVVGSHLERFAAAREGFRLGWSLAAPQPGA